MTKKKSITLDDLAVMVKRGFDETATKAELKHGLDSLANVMNTRFDGVNQRIIALGNRLDAMADHRRRIEKLENDLVKIKIKLAN